MNEKNIISDDHILELLRSSTAQEHGFRLLMGKYKERLYWHIRRMVQVHEDADDILQNTFIKIYRGVLAFEGKSQLYTWLYRIATNEAISFLQRKNRQQYQSFSEETTALAQKIRADEWFDGDEIQLKLQVAVAQLPEKQRAVFNLRYFDEMPYHEISAQMGTSVGALKASFHHAVKKIESALTEK